MNTLTLKNSIIEIEKLTNWNPIGIWITSGNGEDDKPDCKLIIYAYWFRIAIKLPLIIYPETKTVYPKWDDETIERLGRNYYIAYTKRDYGFLLSSGHLSIYFGRSTEQHWSCFLPWTQWRFIRLSYYGLQGEFLYTEDTHMNWKARQDKEDLIPKVKFKFLDFDNEEIEVITHIEKREWAFGDKWFKWLSLFKSNKISRSLDLRFTKETGKRKGSWKGGTIGHGIGMLPNELHEAAFRRYCNEHEMKFLGKSPNCV